MINIIYFGYDLFSSCLEELNRNPEINILKIYGFVGDGIFDKTDRVKQIAEQNGIDFTTEKITADELKFQFEQNGCELAFSAGYAYRIPVESVPSFRGVNLHPSLLPQGRGPWPMPYVILNGLKKSGVTVHKISKNFDEGEILLQTSFEVSENEDYRSLEKKIKSAALETVKKLFSDFEFYYKNGNAQGKGQYLKEPSDEERTIYKDTPSAERKKIIRAFTESYVIFSDKNKGE